MNKLFDPGKLNSKKISKSLSLNASFSNYYFTVQWTRDNSSLTFVTLVVSIGGQNQWKQCLPAVETQNDGEMSYFIGAFPDNIKLDIIFSVYPEQNISAAALFVTNTSNSTFRQVLPTSGVQPLTKGKPWSAPITVKLF